MTVAYTLYGDCNLDGSVDGYDLGKLLANYGTTSGMTWAQGDFNYDGAVDGYDLGKLLANYGTKLAASMGGSIDAASYPHLDAEAIQLLFAAGFNVVPEPSSIVLLATLAVSAGLWIAARRRHNRGL